MGANRFFRYKLQTKDVEAARAFYAELMGPHFWSDDVWVAPLPERAAAMGAPAHWQGHLGVDDVEGSMERIVGLGGQRLGPTQRAANGASYAALRDPFGAVLALSSQRGAAAEAPVAWHLHQSRDHERSFACYASIFGWTAGEAVDLGPQMGSHLNFAWNQSGKSVGSMSNMARLPHIHPQWLFFFRVGDIKGSLGRVSALGGKGMELVQMPGGEWVVACEDTQGAAFALYQAAE